MLTRIIFALSFLAFALPSSAALRTFSPASGSWGTAASWSPAIIPTSSDSVVIPTGKTVTISANAACASLTIGSGATATSITLSSSCTLTVSGAIHFLSVTGAVTHLLSVNSCSVSCVYMDFVDHTSATMIANVSITTGTFTATGNISMPGGGDENKLDMTGSGTLNIGGSFTTTGTVNLTAGTVNFNGSGSQTIPALNYFNLTSSSTGARTLASSGTIGISGTFTPGSNAYTNTGSTIDFKGSTSQTIPAFNYNNLTSSSTGARTLASSGSVGIAGTFTPGSNAYTNTGSTIDFNGTGSQTIPAFNYNNLTSSSSGARTLVSSGTIGVSSIFTQGSNAYTNTGSTIDFNGSGSQTIPAFNYYNLTFSAAGARTLASSGTIGIFNTFTPGSNSSTNTGSTIDFNGSGSQTIPAFNYNNLTSSSSGARTLASSGTMGISGTFTQGSNAYTNTGSTLDFNGSGSQTVPAFSYNNLTFSSSGARTLASSGTIGVFNTFTPGSNSCTYTGSTINFNGTGSQTIPAFSYNNLTSSSTGARTLASSGTIVINGTFTPGTNSYTVTGSTVNFTKTGSQLIPSFSFYNLTFSATLAATWTATGALSLGGDLNIGSNCTMDMGSYLLSFTGVPLGTGPLYTANVSSTPIPSGKSWTGKVYYNSPLAQTIVSGNYIDLSLAGGNRTLASSGTIGISGVFTTGSSSYTITGSTIDFNGTGSQTIPAFNYNNLTSSSSGARTLASSGTVGVAGTFTPGTNSYTITNSTINYNGTGSQTITSFDYNHLTSSSSGSRTMGTSDTIGIAGTFTCGTNSYTVTGSTVNINGPIGLAWQDLPGFTFNNLVVSHSARTSYSAPLIILGDFTLKNVLYINHADFAFSGNTYTGTSYGASGKLYLMAEDATPIPAGRTWPYPIVYGASVYQKIVWGNYIDLYVLCCDPKELDATGTISISGIFEPDNSVAYTVSGSVIDFTGGIQDIPEFTYNKLTCSGSGDKTLLSNITVLDDLTINSGRKLVLNDQTLTLDGHFIGTGTITGTEQSSVIVNGTGAAGTLYMDQSINGTTNMLKDLTLNRSASGSLTLGNALKITDAFTPSAGTLATANMLTLISTAAGTARIAAGSGTYITGNVTAERYIPSITRRWRFLSSPMTGATLADWQNEVYITGTGGAANGFDATLSNAPGAYTYDETVPGEFNANGWVAATSTSNVLIPGKGIRIYIRGDRSDPSVLNGTIGSQAAVTLNTTGTVNTGNISIPLTYTNSGNNANDGWNLAGNPYPSPIDWNAFHDAGRSGTDPDFSGSDYSHLDAVISVYDAGSNSYVSYNAVSNIGTGVLSDGVVPSGGSFWVKASAANPVMTMKEAYKTSATPAAMFKTHDNKNFTIKLLKDEITSDEMVVKYMDEASENADVYDLPKLYGEVNISSITDDHTYLSGNCKPFNGTSDTIPLSIKVASTGYYTLAFENAAALLPGHTVLLVDQFTHSITDLNAATTYSFAVDNTNPASTGDHRFMILIDTNPMTAVDETQQNAHQLFAYPALTQGEVTISNASLIPGTATIRVTDLAGKQVAVFNHLPRADQKIRIDLSSLVPGSYLITVLEDNASHPVTFRCVKY